MRTNSNFPQYETEHYSKSDILLPKRTYEKVNKGLTNGTHVQKWAINPKKRNVNDKSIKRSMPISIFAFTSRNNWRFYFHTGGLIFLVRMCAFFDPSAFESFRVSTPRLMRLIPHRTAGRFFVFFFEIFVPLFVCGLYSRRFWGPL